MRDSTFRSLGLMSAVGTVLVDITVGILYLCTVSLMLARSLLGGATVLDAVCNRDYKETFNTSRC